MLKQPRAVWAVAFACVIAFMGIGLVDPILKPIANELSASPSQVSLLFTSYMAVMGVAMLITGVVSSRIGAKRTLLAGLVLIIIFSGLAGASDSIGPIVGGQLGTISWRAPFFGVAVLMTIALVATSFFLPSTPPTARRTSLADPLRALRYPGLLTIALTALFYNMGFFTLLAFTPFPLDMTAMQIGYIFFGWGILLAITSVWLAPVLQWRFGAVPTVLASLTLFGLDLVMMALLTNSKAALVVGVVIAGAFLGVNNTVITEAVMGAAPVERPAAASSRPRMSRRRTASMRVSSSRSAPADQPSEVAAGVLLALDGLEERPEVPLAEAQRPVPLDELEEHGRPVAHRPGEDLQQVTVLVTVDQDLALLQLLDRDPHLADPLAQLRIVVVGVGGVEELDPVAAQDVDRAQDVVGGERDVLASGAVVELEVLVDLRLLLRDRRLVERELHPVVAARDDLAHQRGVIGRDVVADELRHVREAHHLVVEPHPLVHLPDLDVADAVVDGLEEPLGVPLAARDLCRGGDVAGKVGSAVTAAVDQRVPGLAVRRDRGHAHGAEVVGLVMRLHEHGRTRRPGVLDALVDVEHLQGQVHDTVAVVAVKVHHRALWSHSPGEHEPGTARAQHVGLRVAATRLRSAVGLELHAERELVERRGLGRVAHDEADRVHGRHGKGIAGLVVLHEADQLLELVEGQVGTDLFRGQGTHAPRIAVGDNMCNADVSHWTTCPLWEPDMDQLDRTLIELFAAEPRVGVLEASRRLGVARGTVQARLDRLQRTGIVSGWGPQLEPSALDHPVTAFLTLEIRQGSAGSGARVGGHEAVGAHLATIPELLEACTITGPGDLWCRVVARSNTDLQRVIDRVLAHDGIVRCSTVIALATQVPYRVLPTLGTVVADCPTAGRAPT